MQSDTAPTYLTSPSAGLWRLSADGEAFVWTEYSATFAFTEQLAILLQQYCKSNSKLPSLTAIFFILDAANNWHSKSRDAKIQELETLLDRLYKACDEELYSNWEPELRRSVAEWLADLRRLPAAWRETPKYQAEILRVLMANHTPQHYEADLHQALEVIQWLHVHFEDRVSSASARENPARCQVALTLLVGIAARFPTWESIQTQLETGLRSLPDPESIEQQDEEAKSYREILNELKEDPELGHIAAMSLTVASSLSLPRRPSDPDELPAGGVSDITNRGHPENLLMTELAADPMLLLARIATGQALYLRREKPPISNKGVRHVFVENSIRSWGQCRVFQAVVALAIAASEERRAESEPMFWTIADSDLNAENLRSRDGIAAHLGRLSPSPHPKAAIQEILERDMLSDAACEPLFILPKQSDQDEGFRSQLDQLPKPFLLAQVDRDGTVSLLRRSNLGDEQLHQQRVDSVTQPTRHLPKPKQNLPMFYSMGPPWPLRATPSGAKWRKIIDDREVWIIDRRNRLLCFDTPGKGAIEVAEDLPHTQVLADHYSQGRLSLLLAQKSTSQLKLCSFDKSGESSTSNIDAPSNVFAFDRDCLLSISDREVEFLDAKNGNLIATLGRFSESESLRSSHLGEAYFQIDRGLFVASYQAGKLDWHKLGECRGAALAVGFAEGKVVTVTASLDSMSVYEAGRKPQHTSLRVGYSSLASSSVCEKNFRAEKLLIQTTSTDKGLTRTSTFSLHVGTNHINPEKDYRTWLDKTRSPIHPSCEKLVTHRGVRTKLQSIAVGETGVYLTKNYRNTARICARPGTIWLGRTHLPADVVRADFKPCEELARGRAWRLKRADLPGAVAWHDRRGMLHLRRLSDMTELTLVLDDAGMAGWFTPKNITFGHPYHLHESSADAPDEVIEWLAEFAKQCFRSKSV